MNQSSKQQDAAHLAGQLYSAASSPVSSECDLLRPDGSAVRVNSTGGRHRRLLVLAVLLVALGLCLGSLACLLLLPSFVSSQISRRMVLKNNSLLLERWSKSNVPMLFKVWLFDVRNAADLASGRSQRPDLRELGPFVFRLRRKKDVLSVAGDSLFYTERRIFHFDRSLSCCALNTSVTMANIPLVAVVDRALGYNLPLVGRFIPRLVNRAIQSLREQLFVKRQARELLFDGYEVELLRMVSRLGSIVGLPQTSQRFGILKGRNDTWRPTEDGVWAIHTGLSDRRQFGRVISWNAHKELPFWPGQACNQINGSDGTLFPAPISPERPLHIFNNELCRTVSLSYAQASDIRAIKALRFQLSPANFAHTKVGPTEPANSPRGPPNPFSCFCDRKQTNLNGVNVCEFDGLMDLSKCSKHAQVVFGSMPHFHMADPRLLAQVQGLQPNGSRHTTYLDIEPNTGLVLGGKRRVQLNLMVKRNNEIDGFQNIRDMLIPLLWFEESAQIPEESAEKFRSLYTDRIRRIQVLLASLFVASLGLLLLDLHLAAGHWGHYSTSTTTFTTTMAATSGISTDISSATINAAGSVVDKPTEAEHSVIKPVQV